MSTCPKCGADIDHLKHYSPVEEVFIFRVENGEADYESVDFLPLLQEGDWECPVCNVVLTHDEQSAIALLGGNKP